MSGPSPSELVGVIDRQLEQAERLYQAVRLALSRDIPLIGRTGNAAVMIAGLVENYYTCIETAFHKVSQFFENHLDPTRWHADLLDKMTLRIEGVRVEAVSDAAYGPLRELQRFRHFKRYYFDTAYDWDRVDFVLKKLDEAHPRVVEDLRRFQAFLRTLAAG